MNDDGAVLDFGSFEIQEIKVIAPDKKEYVLREANGLAAKDHRNAIMDSTKFGPDGKVVGISGLASVEAKFVAACLWDDKGKHPAVATVESWPARVQKQLYEKAKELSHITEDSPIRNSLKAALAAEGSPITFDELSAFIESVADVKEFKPIKRLLEKEESAKNS